jgi:chromosome segregation ATPase
MMDIYIYQVDEVWHAKQAFMKIKQDRDLQIVVLKRESLALSALKRDTERAVSESNAATDRAGPLLEKLEGAKRELGVLDARIKGLLQQEAGAKADIERVREEVKRLQEEKEPLTEKVISRVLSFLEFLRV